MALDQITSQAIADGAISAGDLADSSITHAKLAVTGVTAGDYGSASQVPVLTINAKGQITAASTTAVAGVSSVSYDSTTGVLTINTSNGGSYTPDLGIGSSDSPTFSSLTLTGNLTVNGTTTTISATNLSISDPLIYMGQGNSANANDLGIVGHFNNGTYQHTGLVRDASDGKWKLFSGVTTEPTTEIDFTSPTYDTIKTGGIETGHIIPNANTTYDLGSSSYQWRNIYTGDLHMSNEGHEVGNSIDGTKGNWTIQEGDSELYIINNKNGKKYKFKLEEV